MAKKLTEEEKAQVLARVAEIGAAAAAKEAGVHYNSVLRWVNAAKTPVKAAVKKSVAGNPLEKIDAQITAKEEEIGKLEEALKAGKAELKNLQKAKMKAEKEKEKLEAAEQKKQLLDAVLNSGRSVDEIMSFLNS